MLQERVDGRVRCAVERGKEDVDFPDEELHVGSARARAQGAERHYRAANVSFLRPGRRGAPNRLGHALGFEAEPWFGAQGHGLMGLNT